jgi:hypothetical protein
LRYFPKNEERVKYREVRTKKLVVIRWAHAAVVVAMDERGIVSSDRSVPFSREEGGTEKAASWRIRKKSRGKARNPPSVAFLARLREIFP